MKNDEWTNLYCSGFEHFLYSPYIFRDIHRENNLIAWNKYLEIASVSKSISFLLNFNPHRWAKMRYPLSNPPTHPNDESQYWLRWVSSSRATFRQSTTKNIASILHSHQWQRHKHSSDCLDSVYYAINKQQKW